MEELWLEGDETGENPLDPRLRQLEDATYEPRESVEQRGEIAEAEAVESAFITLIEESGATGEESIQDPGIGPLGESSGEMLVSSLSKVDSFTWKLQVAKDEVGEFRIPSKHSSTMVESPDLDKSIIPDDIFDLMDDQMGSDDGEDQTGQKFPEDPVELGYLVMGTAYEDIERDVEEQEKKQEAITEAKEHIRDQIESLTAVELDEHSEVETRAFDAIQDHAAQDPVYAPVESQESIEPTAKHGDPDSEPHFRVDPATGQVQYQNGEPGEVPDRGKPVGTEYPSGHEDKVVKEKGPEEKDSDEDRESSDHKRED